MNMQKTKKGKNVYEKTLRGALPVPTPEWYQNY
jgi:hypothetical protein